MLDERVAEGAAGERRSTQSTARFGEGGRERELGVCLRVVGAADDGLGQLEPLFDAGQSRGKGCREREIGVRVGRCDPVLAALTLRTGGNHANRRRAVLDAPIRSRRCPHSRHEPSIGVHRRADHREQLRQIAHLPRHEMPHHVAHLEARTLRVEEIAARLRIAERDVDVAALARVVVAPLRHEGRHQTLALHRDLREGLEERGLVGGAKARGMADRGLDDAGARLGVETFEAAVEGGHRVHQRVVELGVDGASQDRIAEHSRRHGLEIAVALLAHAFGRLVEQEELVFEGRLDVEAEPRRVGERSLQHAAGTDLLIDALEAADEQQRIRLPRHPAQGREIEPDRRIAVARMPTGDFDAF